MAKDQEYDDYSDGGDGFDGYVETTADPGIWLLLATTVFCFLVMLVIVPGLVYWKVKRRRKKQQEEEVSSYVNVAAPLTNKPQEEVTISVLNVIRLEQETRKILALAIPFTTSALTSSIFSNICLILVSRFVGTKAVTAYALVQVLVGLSDGILYGPISACTTLCAHAVGAGNAKLAGEYIQLAITFYMLLNIPVVLFWWYYMYEIILYLEWGDVETALLSQQFIRVYIWSYLFGAISSGLWQLLEIADHALVGTGFSILWGAMNVLLIGILVAVSDHATLGQVGMIYNITALIFILLTYTAAERGGWLKPFKEGLFHSFALKNRKAVRLMLKQAVPLSWGSLLSNAEWAILTFFASHLGAAEVAAWAILGSIWDIFYTTTSGIGDAAEIRVAHHLGENHPSMAQLSAYKSLFLGMVVASVVSIVYFSLQNDIPEWFTVDATLQTMLRELVPFVGVANLTMTFGMQCWSLIGAQGKYKLATWISFVSSWGVCMPLAAIFVYGFRIDLQGLTSAVVVGYVSTGAALSFVLLSTDWKKVAQKIQERNAETASGEAAPAGERDDDVDAEEELYASLNTRSNAARAAARRNIRLLSLPSGRRSGLIVGNVYSRPGTYVLMVRQWSPLYGRVRQGDSVLAVNGHDVTNLTAQQVTSKLKEARNEDRTLAVVVPLTSPIDDEEETLIDGIAEDATSGSTELPPMS